MKHFIVSIFIAAILIGCAGKPAEKVVVYEQVNIQDSTQINNYRILLDSAKALFRATMNVGQEDIVDYKPIASMFEKAVKLNPKDAEARYFLGYTYGRMNSHDGRSMVDMDLDLLYKTSEQFEKVIELEPKYTGEIIVLDSYSKISSEWGSMAMGYWYRNKADSAVWAFKEGKKRGGFSDVILELIKIALDECGKNAILISSGDNFVFSLWYLQIVENYRTDVAVVITSLFNTIWYPAFLSDNKVVAFDLSKDELDSLDHIEWKDSVVTIGDFSWTVKPSYDNYLLRGDRVFLSLLKANKFQRELYFTVGYLESERLSLSEYLSRRILVDKLSVSGKDSLSFEDYKKTISQALKVSKHLNLKNTDEHKFFDFYVRYNILYKIHSYLLENEKEKLKELMELLDTFANDKKYPYIEETGERALEDIRKRM